VRRRGNSTPDEGHQGVVELDFVGTRESVRCTGVDLEGAVLEELDRLEYARLTPTVIDISQTASFARWVTVEPSRLAR
jgi:hypothetical protein